MIVLYKRKWLLSCSATDYYKICEEKNDDSDDNDEGMQRAVNMI